ncbi:hypothetical protein Ae201684P_019088 [Aphanomyces euteiches]|uniref:Uncharacterized protein n=1 Tax=Aphanomyces euteiches TaxID=100861 RepID=A0A6G0XE57_9STRA|nr:hypothetical protein Ae201684_005674 [Aphanomyces euteiches]KAH9077982.1 hypothetical protein Ae201684P_019088 [Aphanomyces euteiches]
MSLDLMIKAYSNKISRRPVVHRAKQDNTDSVPVVAPNGSSLQRQAKATPVLSLWFHAISMLDAGETLRNEDVMLVLFHMNHNQHNHLVPQWVHGRYPSWFIHFVRLEGIVKLIPTKDMVTTHWQGNVCQRESEPARMRSGLCNFALWKFFMEPTSCERS